MNNWLIKVLFISCRAAEPDGRPLYAYKIREKDYLELRELVRQEFARGRAGQSLVFDRLFCLFAAETWRRRHDGGRWAWETVFNEIGQEVPSHNWIASVVEHGLKWWKRPLLTTASSRRFLVTIACEGGLPLKLLQKENASLRKFFRNVLNVYHEEKKFGVLQRLPLARRCAADLPPSLRQEIVFSLSDELIGKIIELQELVGDTEDPVAALDDQRPDWRMELPLPLENDIAKALLKNLMDESVRLARHHIRWRRLLVRGDRHWSLSMSLELPRKISGLALQQLSNNRKITEIPRLRLFLQAAGIQEQVALLTLLRGKGDEAVYRCEILPRGGVRLAGRAAVAGTALYLSDGQGKYRFSVPGEQELGELPWFFEAHDNELRFIGEGAVKTRAESVYALAPPTGEFDGEAEPKGEATECGRMVFLLRGSGRWRHPGVGVVPFQCSTVEELAAELVLDGPQLSLPVSLGGTPPYRGIPRLVSIGRSGLRKDVAGARASWRPARGEDWSTDLDACAGDVWIRYVDRDDRLLLLRRIQLVPDSFAVQAERIGNSITSGVLKLTDGRLADVRPETIEGYQFAVERCDDGVRLLCRTELPLPMPQFSCRLYWDENRFLTLTLPFPGSSAAFVLGGKALPPGARVAVSRLAVVQAVVQQPLGNRSFVLEANVRSHDEPIGFFLERHIQADEYGRGEFDLLHIQEDVKSWLALTGNLDAVGSIRILGQGGDVLAELRVGLFESWFVPDYDAGIIRLSEESLRDLGDEWPQRLRVSMMRLWDPDAEQVVLELTGTGDSWEVPDRLEPGPWLVLGEDGDWPRFRPVLWNVAGEAAPGGGELEQAIRQADADLRQRLMDELLQRLADDPNHPDWPRVDTFVALSRRYPACTYDLLSAMVGHPQTMVMALLRSSDDDFDTVWSLADALPFSWHLVPVGDWKKSAENYFGAMRQALADLPDGERYVRDDFLAFRERVSGRQPFFRQVCDWLSLTLFPAQTLDNSELMLARQAPDVILGFIREEERKFQNRHNADEKYPPGRRILKWVTRPGFREEFVFHNLSRFYRPVRCAPFVAAFIAARGESCDKDVLFELQELRNFDRDWFDMAFAFALCLELTALC